MNGGTHKEVSVLRVLDELNIPGGWKTAVGLIVAVCIVVGVIMYRQKEMGDLALTLEKDSSHVYKGGETIEGTIVITAKKAISAE